MGDSALRGKYHDREPLAFRSPKKIRFFFVRTHQSYAVTKKARSSRRREIFGRVVRRRAAEAHGRSVFKVVATWRALGTPAVAWVGVLSNYTRVRILRYKSP